MAAMILHQVAKGDGAAVQACIDTYGALVWSLARRLLPEPHEAEDAVQEIFTEIWRTAHRFDESRASEATFVAMVARRRIIDRARRRSRAPDLAPLSPEHQDLHDTNAEMKVESGAETALATKLLARLGEDQRRVLTLIVGQGLSHRQVADKLGMPLGSVKTHARRGLLRMRELLAAEGLEPGRRSPA